MRNWSLLFLRLYSPPWKEEGKQTTLLSMSFPVYGIFEKIISYSHLPCKLISFPFVFYCSVYKILLKICFFSILTTKNQSVQFFPNNFFVNWDKIYFFTFHTMLQIKLKFYQYGFNSIKMIFSQIFIGLISFSSFIYTLYKSQFNTN